METIAFYREEIIKTYGFVERTGLCLVTIDLPTHQAGDGWGRLLDLPFRLGVSPLLLISRPLSETSLRFHLLLEETRSGNDLSDDCRGFLEKIGSPAFRIEKEVELVFFQGPHFGDRYGIAYAALSALSSHQVPALAVACTGASIHLVLPKGKARSAQEALGTAFMTPKTADR